MNCLELDEAQGLSAEMLRAYMVTTGWTFRNLPLDGSEDGRAPELRGGARYVMPCRWDGLAWIVHTLADYEARHVQAMLRDINPRMRRGVPSRAALEAHGETGDWLCTRKALHAVLFCWSVNEFIQMVDGFDVFSTETRADEEMMQDSSFWPCDAAGNKVRWPTDEHGVML